MARSLNRVQLIGNLTRDPELRYTPNGMAVCSFSLATSRSWTTDSGEKKEVAEFHRIVAWNKLAELCSQYLTKGRKAYVEGRLSTRSWTAKDGSQRQTTEIVIDNMIILDSKRPEGTQAVHTEEAPAEEEPKKSPKAKKEEEEEAVEEAPKSDEEVAPDDIPF
jgi:single-strand DNA-binding protein